MLIRIRTMAFAGLFILLFSDAAFAQKDVTTQGARVDAVHQLGVLLNHDDLKVSSAAFQALKAFSGSDDPDIRNAADFRILVFKQEATEWMTENAHVFRETRSMPEPGKQRTRKRCFEIVLLDCEPGNKELAYLAAFDIGLLAFVNVPSITDQQLVCLNNQPLLFSLTLENTQITGSGFSNVELPGLQVLFLTGSPVDDTGLRELDESRFPVLTDITVTKTLVSTKAIDRQMNENQVQVRIRK